MEPVVAAWRLPRDESKRVCDWNLFAAYVKPQPCSGAGRTMHLLIIILQQLLGMLPSSKQAPQAEVVRRERPQPKGSEPDACLRRACLRLACLRRARPIIGWMSVLAVLSWSSLAFATAARGPSSRRFAPRWRPTRRAPVPV